MATRQNDPQRRERILEATLACIAAHGFHHITHRKIALEAGVPLGSVTYYFTTLEALLAEAFTRFAESMSCQYQALMLAVSTAGMGIVLFGLSVGSMSGILCSGWLVKRLGTHTVIRNGMALGVIGMLLMALALWFASPLLFASGLAVLGAGMGSAEVALNVEGATVEQLQNKTVLPMMHGFYSLGTLIGAGIGLSLTAFHFRADLHLAIATLITVIPIIIGLRAIPKGVGIETKEARQQRPAGHIPFWRDTQLLLIGLIVLAMAFAEGSANDWLPLPMGDGHGFPTSS